jgi:hypothetical protein
MEIMPEIRTFLSERAEYPQLLDCRWLFDLTFLTDMTTKLNELNRELQGVNQTIIVLMSSVNGFMKKLDLWIEQLQRGIVKHFPQTTAELSRQQSSLDQEVAQEYAANLKALKTEFSTRFSEFKAMESVVTFIAQPF